jgi:hypothetical protein
MDSILLQINDEASDKVLEIEQKYNEIRKPVYDKRNEIIKSIPDFWLNAVSFTYLLYICFSFMLVLKSLCKFCYCNSYFILFFCLLYLCYRCAVFESSCPQ